MLIYYLILIFLGFLLAWLVLFFGKQVLFASTMLHGPVFVPSADDKLATMLKLAKPNKQDKIVDLGAGDGKVVIALAKLGYRVEGVEINSLLVRRANKNIAQLGLEKLAVVKKMNFWKLDFSQYDLIFLYGTSYIMEKLEKKLIQELKPGARVISNYFQFPHWRAKKTVNDVRVYLQA